MNSRTLKMEAAGSTKKLVTTYKTALRHVREDIIFNKNLKSYIFWLKYGNLPNYKASHPKNSDLHRHCRKELKSHKIIF